MERIRNIVTGRSFAVASIVGFGVLGSSMPALAAGTVDPNLQNATNSVTSYFSNNIPLIITAVVGIVLLLWFLAMLFRSVGAKKAKSAT